MSADWLLRKLLNPTTDVKEDIKVDSDYYSISFNISKELDSVVPKPKKTNGRLTKPSSSYCDYSVTYFSYRDEGQNLEVTMEPLDDLEEEVPLDMVPITTCLICESTSTNTKEDRSLSRRFPSTSSVQVLDRMSSEYPTLTPARNFLKYLPFDDYTCDCRSPLHRFFQNEVLLAQEDQKEPEDHADGARRTKSHTGFFTADSKSTDEQSQNDIEIKARISKSDSSLLGGKACPFSREPKPCEAISRRFNCSHNELYIRTILDNSNHVYVTIYIQKPPPTSNNFSCNIMAQLSVSLTKSLIWPSNDVKVIWVNSLQKCYFRWIKESSAEPIFSCQRFQDGHDAALLFSEKASIYVRHSDTVFLFNLAQTLATYPHRILMLKQR